MNGLQVCQVIVLQVHTDAEEQSSVATIDNLEVSELNKKTHGSKMMMAYSWFGRHMNI